jgi:coproporphyrinogen III oxidase
MTTAPRRPGRNKMSGWGLIPVLLLTLHAQFALASGHNRPRPVIEPEKAEALIERFNAFITKMDDKYLGRTMVINGSINAENREIENEYSRYELRVTRGEVIEKAGRMLSFGKKANPGRGDGVLKWGRFYSLDFHPRSPLVGMLHATIVVQLYEDNTAQVGGWLGIMPGTKIEEDLDTLKVLTDNWFAQHEKDPALYRRLICKGTDDTVAYWRRKPACVGASFYGPPVYRDSVEDSYAFIEGIFDEFVAAYLDIVEKRAKQSFTDADLAAQDEMRLRWLKDQLFSDPFASSIVPFEAWSFANMPPVVKF